MRHRSEHTTRNGVRIVCSDAQPVATASEQKRESEAHLTVAWEISSLAENPPTSPSEKGYIAAHVLNPPPGVLWPLPTTTPDVLAA